MLKRLVIGFLKGALVGAGIGAAAHYGLGWTETPTLLGYLLAMGAGGTAGIVTGKPPWQQEAWVEGVLKATVGVGVGALLFWLMTRFADMPVGGLLGLGETSLAHAPLLYLPPISALYGALVELDNTGESEDEDEPPPGRRAAHPHEEEVPATDVPMKNRRSR